MFVDRIEMMSPELIAVSGFSRGAGFSTKNPVQLTGISCPFIVTRMEISDTDGMGEVIEMSEDERREMIEALTPLRPAEIQEQTWPSAEEEAEADKAIFEQRMKRVVVPHGVAPDSMEAAWLAEDAGAEAADDEETEGVFDWNKLSSEEADGSGSVIGPKVPEFETRTRDEMEFIDEVDTPQNMPARERFQRYRGLKSLRNANWDPYEELPAEYSQIHEFQDLAFTSKQGFESISQNGIANRQIIMWLEPVFGDEEIDRASAMTAMTQQLASLNSVVVSTMAINESKVTVVHCRVQRLPETMDREIKSKDTVIVQCGFRRIEVRPIFSEIPKYSASTGTCPIQRMHRQLPNDSQSSILMSFYAPAIFGSNPVLVFDKDSSLLLWGSVAGCAPNKPVIVKRITLTGYPFRVHQTRAVCRFMFFSPEDIDWFKPVELSTKKGLRGHILESLGTHGYMKCRFNGQLTSDDIICMHMYKRVYPKWHPAAWAPMTVHDPERISDIPEFVDNQ
jgi:pre-rRNA-processing protein TSR1